MDDMKDRTKMISQQLEQQKEYVAYKEMQLTKNDTGKLVPFVETFVVIVIDRFFVQY